MRHEAYVRVADERPLYFLGFITAAKAERWHGIDGLRGEIDRFRSRAIAAGVGNPYIVVAGSDIVTLAPTLGSDAVGAYAISEGRGIGDYAALARIAEAGWQSLAGAGLPVPGSTARWMVAAALPGRCATRRAVSSRRARTAVMTSLVCRGPATGV